MVQLVGDLLLRVVAGWSFPTLPSTGLDPLHPVSFDEEDFREEVGDHNKGGIG
jgi:hypothetical protein